DHFVHQVMEEIGIDMSVHTPHTMDELKASSFDIIVTLAEDARAAVEERGIQASVMEHWTVADPSETEDARDAVLRAYRDLRDDLEQRLREELESMLERAAVVS